MMNPFLNWIGHPIFDLLDVIIVAGLAFLAGSLLGHHIIKE